MQGCILWGFGGPGQGHQGHLGGTKKEKKKERERKRKNRKKGEKKGTQERKKIG